MGVTVTKLYGEAKSQQRDDSGSVKSVRCDTYAGVSADAGRLRAEYRGAAAEIGDAVASYNQAVLRAVRETSDQLSLVCAPNGEIVDQQRALDDTEGAYQLAEERYRAGVSSYLTVLTAETAVLKARREHVALVCDQAIARVNLLIAVGGSFDRSP